MLKRTRFPFMAFGCLLAMAALGPASAAGEEAGGCNKKFCGESGYGYVACYPQINGPVTHCEGGGAECRWGGCLG